MTDLTVLTEDCIHLLPLVACNLCMDAATGRPTGTPIQRWRGRQSKPNQADQMVVVSKGATVRPFDPSEWTKDEWRNAVSGPVVGMRTVWSKAEKRYVERPIREGGIRRSLRSLDRDRYDGRTLGPKDQSIKPINRTRR